MRNEQPSHLRAALRLALTGMQRRRSERPDPRVIPGRKLAVERRGIEVDPARVRRYLIATRGSNPSGAGDAHALLPPTYTAVWETALALDLLALEGLPFPSAGLIHLRSELVVIRPLRVQDRVRCRLELERIDRHPRGTRLALRCRNWNEAGQLCQEDTAELLVRSRDRGSSDEDGMSRDRAATAGAQSEDVQWREHSRWSLPADAGRRYARASGDFNPIHLWPWTARWVGYSRPILHGHCSMAMIAHELRGRAQEPSSAPLRTMEAIFRAPLSIPATVRLMVGSGSADAALRFRLQGTEDGGGGEGRPYVEGRYVG